MTGYIHIKHPITGDSIKAVPTGKKRQQEIEVIVITPKSNLDFLWITPSDITIV